VFLLAVTVGLVAGIGESSLFLILQSQDRLPWLIARFPVSLDILWVAPLVDLAIFTAVGAMLALASGLWRSPKAVTAAFTVLMFLLVYDWLAIPLTDRLRNRELLLLAAGIAVALGRGFERRREQAQRFIGRLTLAVMALVVATGLGTRLLHSVAERSELSALPPAADDAPNVVLLVIDTLRADHLSSYGYTRATSPAIDRLARDGVLFENAFATSSWTPVSHASIFTGRYGFEHGVEWNSTLGPDLPTLAERLKSEGYRTAAFSGNRSWVTKSMGFDRGFIRFEESFHSVADAVFRTLFGRKLLDLVLVPQDRVVDYPGRRDASSIRRGIVRWASENSETPFFVFANIFDAHSPYLPPEPFRGRFSRQPRDLPAIRYMSRRRTPLRPDEIQRELDAYDESIAYVDDQVRLLLEEIELLPTPRRTLIILTSDHGEFFGEHGLIEHRNALYREGIRVPLILSMPGVLPPGVRVTEPVTNASLAATIMPLTGDAHHPFPGVDLSRHWAGSRTPKPALVLSEIAKQPQNPNFPTPAGDAYREGLRSIVEDRWHYIWHESGREELFDLVADPDEKTNLVGRSDVVEVLSRLRGQLESVTRAGPAVARASGRRH
jgi:arylsulfatase A-like enzyme